MIGRGATKRQAMLADIFRDLLERQGETIAALQGGDYPTALMGAVEDRDQLRRLLRWSLGVRGGDARDYFDGERRTDDDNEAT